MTEKKMGRPTDNPKNIKLTVRFDNDTWEILDNYCKREQISKVEGVRKAVKCLKDDK